MYSALLVLLTALACTPSSKGAKTLPNFVTPCKLDDEDISRCYKKNIEDLRPRLEKGIRELQIQPIDPLKVSDLILSRNDTAAVSYRVVFKDLLLSGGKDFKIKALKVDLKTPSFKVKLNIPRVIMKSGFFATGVLLGFPLKEPGSAIVDFGNVSISYSCEGEKVAKKGKTFIEWNDGKFDTNYDEIRIEVNGVLNDVNQQKLFNEALNENARALAPHIDAVLKNAFGVYITESLRGVHKIFPVDVLYP